MAPSKPSGSPDDGVLVPAGGLASGGGHRAQKLPVWVSRLPPRRGRDLTWLAALLRDWPLTCSGDDSGCRASLGTEKRLR